MMREFDATLSRYFFESPFLALIELRLESSSRCHRTSEQSVRFVSQAVGLAADLAGVRSRESREEKRDAEESRQSCQGASAYEEK